MFGITSLNLKLWRKCYISNVGEHRKERVAILVCNSSFGNANPPLVVCKLIMNLHNKTALYARIIFDLTNHTVTSQTLQLSSRRDQLKGKVNLNTLLDENILTLL